MSNRYSSSPTLHLAIADSIRCRCLQLLHFTALLAGAGLFAHAGHLELAVLIILFLCMCLPALVGQPWVGWLLGWRNGRWTLDRGAGAEPVQLCPQSRVGPGGVFVRLRDAHGAHHRLWLLPDAVPADELRKLRVRLRLERGVQGREHRIQRFGQ